MTKVIEIENLTKTYGKHRGVEKVSFSVEKGEIFGFLGPNGAGKSTTIRSMLGMLRYEQGTIKLLGRDANKERTELLKEIGYMPSEAMFYSDMRVKDIIKLAADMRKKDCEAEAYKLCERLQIDTQKKIEELSLGNRKKVSIVCAMQHRPKLFVFDEPTSGLDPLMQNEFFKLVQEYVAQGATCFLSTHVLSEVKKYCGRVAIMKEGRLLCVDSVENLTKSSAKQVQIVRNGQQEEFLFQGQLKDLFVRLSQEDITDVLISEPSLEEAFLHYYNSNDEKCVSDK